MAPEGNVLRKTIIVTGASQGIGRATALRFVEGGWTVGALARREGPLREMASAHPGLIPLVADVTDETAVARAFAAFVEAAGRLDAVFSNAGRGAPAQGIDEIGLAVWRDVLEVNLTGMFLVAREAFRIMRRQSPQGGRIIMNGSVSSVMPRPGAAPYTASKHGVLGLTKTLSLEGRAYDIACGQIDIGNAATPMTERMDQGVPQADGSIRPEPRMDVAHAADCVFQMASLPLSANVQQMTVMATKMPLIGRG